jgi:hypothetical protein
MQPSPTDLSAINQTTLDYIEGFYAGDAARMERALHPELAKRIVRPDPGSARSQLVEMSALTLVQITEARVGRPTPEAERQRDVLVLDVFENAASVKVVAGVDRLPARGPVERSLGDRQRAVGDETGPSVHPLVVSGSPT